MFILYNNNYKHQKIISGFSCIYPENFLCLKGMFTIKFEGRPHMCAIIWEYWRDFRKNPKFAPSTARQSGFSLTPKNLSMLKNEMIGTPLRHTRSHANVWINTHFKSHVSVSRLHNSLKLCVPFSSCLSLQKTIV